MIKVTLLLLIFSTTWLIKLNSETDSPYFILFVLLSRVISVTIGLAFIGGALDWAVS